MRTQALRVTVGAYETGYWHVSLVEDTYERGMLRNSVLQYGPIYCTQDQVQDQVRLAVDHLMWTERERVRSGAGAGTQDIAAPTPARS